MSDPNKREGQSGEQEPQDSLAPTTTTIADIIGHGKVNAESLLAYRESRPKQPEKKEVTNIATLITSCASVLEIFKTAEDEGFAKSGFETKEARHLYLVGRLVSHFGEAWAERIKEEALRGRTTKDLQNWGKNWTEMVHWKNLAKCIANAAPESL